LRKKAKRHGLHRLNTDQSAESVAFFYGCMTVRSVPRSTIKDPAATYAGFSEKRLIGIHGVTFKQAHGILEMKAKGYHPKFKRTLTQPDT
jgi:hypothetical protein